MQEFSVQRRPLKEDRVVIENVVLYPLKEIHLWEGGGGNWSEGEETSETNLNKSRRFVTL